MIEMFDIVPPFLLIQIPDYDLVQGLFHYFYALGFAFELDLGRTVSTVGEAVEVYFIGLLLGFEDVVWFEGKMLGLFCEEIFHLQKEAK